MILPKELKQMVFISVIENNSYLSSKFIVLIVQPHIPRIYYSPVQLVL